MTMAKVYPRVFRDDAVRVARKPDAPLSQIARDFGVSEATLHNSLKRADIEDGNRPGLNDAERAEIRALKKRARLLEQENKILRRVAIHFAKDLGPK
jgi:transposase